MRQPRLLSRLFPRNHCRGLQQHAVSNDLKSPPPKAKQWDPWKSPFTWVVAFIPIFTFGLGTWQVRRLSWKNDVVRQAEQELEKEPIVLPDHIDLASLSPYRQIVTQGSWLHVYSLFLGPRKYGSTNGYHLLTPLARKSPTSPQASTILVNRGFVSDMTALAVEMDASRFSQRLGEDGIIEIRGMISPPFVPSLFTPENNPEKGEWIWTDIPALVERSGGQDEDVQGVLVDVTFEGGPGDASALIGGGKPVGRHPSVVFRNQHASYALTWYSLSLGTSILLVRLLRRKPPTALRKF
ncbi:surf-like protein [Serendipita sp. 407]|nr:surf-like protein [Serendipita sp. 407]